MASYCCYCKNQVTGMSFEIYFLTFFKDNESLGIMLPIKEVIYIIQDFCFDNLIHMSATEIILLRPDIVLDIFTGLYREKKINRFAIASFPICQTCYGYWKEKNPIM